LKVFGKLECLNPGGSLKDRPALRMLIRALDSGLIREGGMVIESSSGNMGVGLAQVCRYLGLRFTCVVDPKTTEQNLRLLRAYGANLDWVTQPDQSGEFLQARIDRVQELLRIHPGSYWPNQYANVDNAAAHHDTMREIVGALDGLVDYLFCATSTCGTLRGCAEYVQAHDLNTIIIAVDAVGSIIFGGRSKKRVIPGHGAAIHPPLFAKSLADRCVRVTDLQCVWGCRELLRTEALLLGGSSGAIASALRLVSESLVQGATCALILPDRGERYLDTIYSDEWVKQHFGQHAVQSAMRGQKFAGKLVDSCNGTK
jgi:cysteine synthase A